MQPMTSTVGYVAANDQAVAASQSVTTSGSLTLTSSPVTFAYPAQLVITTSADYTAVTVTISGTDYSGNLQSETIQGPNTSASNSALFYKTVTSVTTNGGVGGGAMKVGTTGVTSSRWMALDAFALNYTTVQVIVSGSATYTVQSTLDDPNDSRNPVAASSVTWFNSNDANVVNQTQSEQSNFAFTPSYTRTLMSAGNGTVTTTVAQSGVVNL